MPIKIPRGLPAYNALANENVFVMTEERAETQDIRPLRIAIINLMPTTVATEIQLLRLLGHSPIQVDISLLRMGSHESKNAPPGHLDKFYIDTNLAMKERFDGLIITGAPVETLAFPDVDYWDELRAVFDWADKNVFSTLHICWGAQAGLYHRYGVQKRVLEHKIFGVFPSTIDESPRKACGSCDLLGHRDSLSRYDSQSRHDSQSRCDDCVERAPLYSSLLFRGFDDEFYAPQSRWTDCDAEAVHRTGALTVHAESPEVGIFIAAAREGREIYVTGHLEYEAGTLDREYKRDLEKGEAINIPKNYYPNDDASKKPVVRWRSHAHLFFSNWIAYVYQGTPYDLREL
jgi:homoserine O-succinyltransferase